MQFFDTRCTLLDLVTFSSVFRLVCRRRERNDSQTNIYGSGVFAVCNSVLCVGISEVDSLFLIWPVKYFVVRAFFARRCWCSARMLAILFPSTDSELFFYSLIRFCWWDRLGCECS
jgi:hypothetical protein